MELTIACLRAQIRNLNEAERLWKATPPEQVVKGLDEWRCGTQACFGGHLATWPYFQELGVTQTPSGGPVMLGEDTLFSSVSKVLFGRYDMTASRGLCDFDTSDDSISDHDVVLNRIERQREILQARLDTALFQMHRLDREEALDEAHAE